VVETRTVEIPVEVVKPLPESLTAPLPYPPALSEGFTFEDLAGLIEELYGVIDVANADRAKAGRLSQPGTGSPAPP
jgi:hypothetical protein